MLRGGLFTRYFLEDGIREMDAYRRLADPDVEDFAAAVQRLWPRLAAMPHPNEAETEAEFIFPILGRLGWQHLPQQEPGRGRRDIADALLFTDPHRKSHAPPSGAGRSLSARRGGCRKRGAGHPPRPRRRQSRSTVFADPAFGTGPYRDDAPLWLGNLNSLVFDYVARQKVQGQHVNWYIVEQLPVVPPEHYMRRFRAAERG